MSKVSRWLRDKKIFRGRHRLPEHVRVGRYSHNLSSNSFLYCTEKSPVDIGSFCAIAPGVLFICQADHPTGTASNFGLQNQILMTKTIEQYLQTKGPIVVGNDVWIGARAIILSGVTIGNGAVVAAGSVVTKDVPPYAIAAGNPARPISYRFSVETIEAMQRIRWWDWPLEKLKLEKAAFDLPAERFVERFG